MVTKRSGGRALPAGPLASGAPYWIWFGDRLALDFVNTIRGRRRAGVDLLVTADDLAAWLIQADVLPSVTPVSERLLREARGLRATIDAGVELALAGEHPSAEVADALNGWLRYARTEPPRIVFDDGAPVLVEHPSNADARWALGRIALDAGALLTGPAAHRVRVCEGDGCGVRFFDRSRRGRRWCSMGACG